MQDASYPNQGAGYAGIADILAAVSCVPGPLWHGGGSRRSVTFPSSKRRTDLAPPEIRGHPYRMRDGTGHSRASCSQAAADDGLSRPLGIKSWRGASGRSFVHVVYSLLCCPPLIRSTYLLVRRSRDGHRKVLTVGRTTAAAPTVDLAQIRHIGSRLGVNEVHVCACNADLSEDTVLLDLAAAQLANDQLRH